MAIQAPPFQQYGRSYRTMCAVRCWIILISILAGIAVLEGGVTAQDPDTMDTSTTTSTAEEEETNDSIAAVFEEVDVPTGDQEIPCATSPEALTQAYGKAIPRTCLEVPYYETTMERCYYTYVPDPASAACRSTSSSNENEDVLLLPLVFDIHGLTSCPLFQASYSGWLEKADEDCFVVVYPIGNIDNERWLVNRCWNLPGFLTDEMYGEVDGAAITTSPCCCYEQEDEETENPMGFSLPVKEPDDPLFLRMVIDAVVDSFLEDDEDKKEAASVDNAAEDATLIGTNTTTSTIQIDRARVYMAGHSNGCMTSLTMAALYSEEIAAVCCHAGALVTPIPAASYSAVPVWMAHGMLDSTAMYNGASLLDMGPFGNFGTWSTVDAMNYIADQNECNTEVHEDELYEDEKDGAVGVGKVYKRTNCTNTADVELVALYDVGHFPYSAAVIESFGETRATIDTTQLAWEFCSSHSKPNTSIPPTQTTENSTTEDSTNSNTDNTVDGDTVHNEKEEELSKSNNTISTVHDDEQEDQGKNASTPSTTDSSSAAAIASTPLTMMTCCILSIVGSMIN